MSFEKLVLLYNNVKVFVELEELCKSPYGGLEWRETARWIKYEEAVEQRSNRWGKPFVSFINFNALFSLRKGLENGSVVLDLDAKDMTTVANKIAEYLVISHQIPTSQKENISRLLMLNRRHVKENIHPLRRASRFTSMSMSVDEENPNLEVAPSQGAMQSRRSRSSSIRKSFANILKTRGSFSASIDSTYDDRAENKNTLNHLEVESSIDEREPPTRNIELKKKLAHDAEAMACFVGVLDFLLQPAIAFVRLSQGTVMDNVIEVPIPVRFFFVLLGPYGAGIDYKEIGRAFSTLMAEKNFHEAVYAADSKGQILSAINDFLNTSIVFPPSDWKNSDLVPLDEIRNRTRENIRKVEETKAEKTRFDDDGMKAVPVKEMKEEKATPPKPPRDPLVRKGIPFYGVVQDIKIRYPRYLSDIVDGFSPQVLSASIFIFFAALSPAITFGGLYGEKTNFLMGVGETLLLSSINGLVFSLFAAQPIIIVGATGPLMIFDLSLLNFCKTMDIDYLGIRVWIGLWILLIGLIVGAFELVAVVRKFTKFTEEIYATLVCIIFIYGAFESMVGIFETHPLIPPVCEENDTILYENATYDTFDSSTDMLNITVEEQGEPEPPVNQPNTALLSMCLMLGTFILAIKLKNLRNKKYFGRPIRRALGDFGVPISIFLMCLIGYFINGVYLDRLRMPEGIQPSNSKIRGWLISPFGVIGEVPVWAMFAAGPASLLLFILIFLEENICHLILSSPERCLKKGTGFHLDIVLSCAINTLSGFLGAPFMSPACVRTITHMSALTVFSDKVAPGEPPKIVGCLEQRISSLTVSILIGLSVLLYFILNLVPNAVLLGVFLYMGVSATAGIQLLDRTFLYLLPVKYHPNVPYAKDVATLKMHLWTLIQIVMLVIAWIVKQSPASLAVPFVLICLIPIRMYILPRIFTIQELIALDGAQKVEEKSGEEPDFYETAHDLPTQIEEEDK
ncbi:UNVERIFIED_CONTAM: hypothetical protein RMT77_012386 [Armadillidium vulgare]